MKEKKREKKRENEGEKEGEREKMREKKREKKCGKERGRRKIEKGKLTCLWYCLRKNFVIFVVSFLAGVSSMQPFVDWR